MHDELITRLQEKADGCDKWAMPDTAALLREAADALSRPATAVQVPEGWKLVPVEPTPGMERAAGVDGERCMCCGYENGPGDPATIYEALLTAAPASPAATGWVKCSERLPAGHGEVLVWDGEFVSIARCYGANRWQVETGGWLGTVSHWQPYPLPPAPAATKKEQEYE